MVWFVFCYIWLFRKFFVILMFVIPLLYQISGIYNKIKAKIDKIEDIKSIVYVIKVKITIHHSRYRT